MRRKGHYARECPKGKGKGKGFKGTCYACGETGHTAKECTWQAKGGKSKGKGWWNNGWKGKGLWAVDEEQDDEEWEQYEEAGDIGAIDYDTEPMKIKSPTDSKFTIGPADFTMKIESPTDSAMKIKELSSIDRAPKGPKKTINEVRSGWERIRVQVDSGAVDTVAPKHIAQAFKLRETAMSKNKVGFAAANGSKIENYGERKVSGYTDEGDGMSLRMTCADVHKVLGSVHKMNKGCNIVVLNGEHSYMKNKRTGQKTKISYEDGQYIMRMWVPAGPKEAEKDVASQLKGNRFAILAADDEQVFSRQVRSR